MAKPYRYQLRPYGGPATRLDCPNCGGKRTLAPYIDRRTNEALPAEYGRCNREEKCGYHRSPYHIEADGLSYKERVHQEHRAANHLSPVATLTRGRNALKPAAPAAKPSTLPAHLLEQSMGQYERNRFARLLQSHFGAGVAAELLLRFQIGTSAYWNGACVFWLVDEQQRVRGGQVVQFDEEGHTVKAVAADGSVRRRTSWVHTALSAHYQRKSQPLPGWLTDYIEAGSKSPCLFGLPQLTTAPLDMPVAIVEAPKTAVLCTPYFPGFTWLAVGALSYLNDSRLTPLRGRGIVLFPDASENGRAYQEWSAAAEKLRRQGFKIEVSDLLEKGATEEQKQQGIDLADLLLTQWEGFPPSWNEH
ncbi:DUF6371 domain-containing protein [Solirubrum puertoriconensis]|uniref:Uncharacterized protein n=1 Tax=Solirubrum puertoriconensis TaxID=1751427 RepID=A0A9X0HNU4_SOLP1|nr:DUF6371 domain-containing protein [Solirubrum puertoriconensis]KUG09389.1 hypothetical protein ASU33_16810 [Solirubrum puertoriconensis]